MANGEITGIIEELQQKTEGDKVTVEAIIDRLSGRSYGPFILVPATLQASPVGGIPGMPVIMGLLLTLFSIQMLFTSGKPWMPKRLRKQTIDHQTLAASLRKANKVLGYVEPFLTARLSWIIHRPGIYFISMLAILLSISIIPMGLIPFAAFLPAFGLVLLGLGLTANDGLVVLVSACFAIGTGYWLYTSFA